MRTPTIPEWCKGLPDTTLLFSCDIGEFFGYETSNTWVYVRDRLIPPPKKDKIGQIGTGHKKSRKTYWLLGDIRKLRKEMLNNENT